MHDLWNDRLSEYLDGSLSPDEVRACEAHLAECTDCTADLTALRALVQSARELHDRTPPVDLWPAISERIGAPAPLSRFPRLARAAAILLVGIGIGYGIAHFTRTPTPDLPDQRFMLFLHQPIGQYRPPPELRDARLAGYQAWSQDPTRRDFVEPGGQLVSTEGYHMMGSTPPQPLPLDSDICEIAGYFTLRARNYEEALELVADHPHFRVGWMTLRRIEEN